MRGDHQLSEQAAERGGPSLVRPALTEEILALMGAHPGSLGAVGFTSAPVLQDESVRGRSGMVTGANRDGFHLRGVDVARDLAAARVVDLRPR